MPVRRGVIEGGGRRTRSGNFRAFAAHRDDVLALAMSSAGLALAAEFRPFLGEQPALLEPVATPVRRPDLLERFAAGEGRLV